LLKSLEKNKKKVTKKLPMAHQASNSKRKLKIGPTPPLPIAILLSPVLKK
jgi:hypothetical protein